MNRHADCIILRTAKAIQLWRIESLTVEGAKTWLLSTGGAIRFLGVVKSKPGSDMSAIAEAGS